MNGKAANDGKPGGCPALMGLRGKRRPGEGRLGGDVVLAAILDIVEELDEELPGSGKLVAEGTAHGQVIGKGLA
jgi:hypothetical protein